MEKAQQGRRRICGRCMKPEGAACVCHALPPAPLFTRTRVVILQHPFEAKQKQATAPLVQLCLAHCHVLRGRRFYPGSHSELDRLLRPACGVRESSRDAQGSQQGSHGLGAQEQPPGSPGGVLGCEVQAGGSRDGGRGVCMVETATSLNRSGSTQRASKRGGAVTASHSESTSRTGRPTPAASSTRLPGVHAEAQEGGEAGLGGVQSGAQEGGEGGLHGVCQCGHVRLLLHPGKEAKDMSCWLQQLRLHGVYVEEGDAPLHLGCASGREAFCVEEWCMGRGSVCCGGAEGCRFTLFLFDGTWQHSLEMARASRAFLETYCQMVALPFRADSDGPGPGAGGLILKKEPKQGLVSTAEAVARAVGLLEPHSSAQDALLMVLRHVVSVQMACMSSRARPLAC